MNRKKELRREILRFLLTLGIVVGLFSGMGLTVNAATTITVNSVDSLRNAFTTINSGNDSSYDVNVTTNITSSYNVNDYYYSYFPYAKGHSSHVS